MSLPVGSYNNIPRAIAIIKAMGPAIVKKAAFDVQATAAAYAPVLTGFLKSSIYVVTMDSSTYGQGATDSATGYLLPSVTAPGDSTTAYIAVGANYGMYVEFGTSKMAAQPYLTPAADAVAPSFVQAWSKLEDYIKAGDII